MPISQPTYPTTTSNLVTHVGSYTDGRVAPVDPQQVTATLGAAYTLAMASRKNVELIGALGPFATVPQSTVTITGITAGMQAWLRVTQPSPGGCTLRVSDGTSTVDVPISAAAGETTMVLVSSPNGTDLDVVGLGGAGDAAHGSRLAVLEAAVFNVREAPYNATGNGVADDTAAIQAAIDAAEAAGGGTVYVPTGIYKVTGLNLDDVTVGVRLEGSGTATAGPGSATLTFPQSTGNLITAKSSFGVVLRGLRMLYTHASYAGHLINLDWSAVQSDPAYFRMENCYAGGNGVSGAASLVRLNTAICCTIRSCTLGASQVQILGRDAGGYSNVIQIENNSFVQHVVASIKNVGESWRIVGNAFQQRADGRAGSIVQDGIVGAGYGLTLNGNWYGDVAVGGGHLVDLSANTLYGTSITGEYFAGGGAAGDCAIKLGGGNGFFIAGNRFTVNTGVNPNLNGIRGVVITGNDFGGAVNPVINVGNIVTGSALGNEGYTDYLYGSSRLGIGQAAVTHRVEVGGTLKTLGVITHTNAGAIADAQFVTVADGLLAVDTFNNRLAVRIGGVWKYVTVA